MNSVSRHRTGRAIGRDLRLASSCPAPRLVAVNRVVVRLGHPLAEGVEHRNIDVASQARPLALVRSYGAVRIPVYAYIPDAMSAIDIGCGSRGGMVIARIC